MENNTGRFYTSRPSGTELSWVPDLDRNFNRSITADSYDFKMGERASIR
jgi:hypothetical protein